MKASENEKTLLRNKIKKTLSHFSLKEKKKADNVICKKVISRPEIIPSAIICVYVSTADEVDTKQLVEYLLSIGKTVAVPRVTDDRLTIHIIHFFDDLAAGSFGIFEPKEGCAKVDTESVDLFIVPGLAFDRKGHRLGRGRGFYDKLLTGVTIPKIGLAYACQVVAEVPFSSYDVPMTAVVTEEDI